MSCATHQSINQRKYSKIGSIDTKPNCQKRQKKIQKTENTIPKPQRKRQISKICSVGITIHRRINLEVNERITHN